MFKKNLITLILGIIFIASPLHAEEDPKVQTDLKELAKLITLPKKAISAKWQMDKMVLDQSSKLGPDDWKLVALIKFSAKNIKKLKKVKAFSVTDNTDLSVYNSYPWLKDVGDVIAKSKFTILDAKTFYKSPLLFGSALQVSKDEVLIYLQTH